LTNEKKKLNKTKISIFLSITLSISIIVLILYFTIDAQTIQYLSQISLRPQFFIFFGIAVLLNILFWIIWGARIKVLSKAADPNVHIGLWEATKIVIANQFLASITPSMAGGEPVRIFLLNKDGLSVGDATATVLGERLIDAIFILVLVPFGFFIFQNRINVQVISYGLSIGIGVFLIGFVLFALALKYPQRIKSLLIFISRKLSRVLKSKDEGSTIVDRINAEVDSFHKSMVFFLTGGKKFFLGAGGLTVLMWSTGFLTASMILLALGLPPFWVESYAAQVLLFILVMLPTTPGSSGVTELGMVGLYGVLLGASNQYLLGVFVLLFRFVTYHMSLMCGAVFQYRIFKSITSFSLQTMSKKEG
jgi:uncharacterized protein (TIRG00374 family)